VYGCATVNAASVPFMADVQRASTRTSLIDILDRVLDKGIVVDAWVRVSVVGVDLITMEARIVVASIDTYVNRADPIALLPPLSLPVNRAPVRQHPPASSPGEMAPGAAALRTRKPRRRTEC
jgi:hypothetical protein